MSAGFDVWSLSRQVPCKGGKTRSTTARRLNPSARRVYLCANGSRQRLHLERELFPLTFPDLVEKQRQEALQRPQARCKKGHPLIDPVRPEMFGTVQPKIAYWGRGNRVCLRCNPLQAETAFDAYSRHSGIHGRNYRGLPTRPAKRRDYFDEL